MITDLIFKRAPASDPLEVAAEALYALSKPQDALPWGSLTHGQQDRYRHLATMAARMTDVTALRAALEAGAIGLAAHKGVTLRDCTPQQRMGLRFDAMDCIRSFEDHLMHGDAEKDARALELQAEEHQFIVNKRHDEALKDDARETQQRDARRDIREYGRTSLHESPCAEASMHAVEQRRRDLGPASGHDGELFGDGRR